MENKYLDSGALFLNNRKTHEKAPDWKGDIELSTDVISYLVKQLKEGKPAKLDFAGWNRTSSKGTSFLSLKASTPFVPKQQSAPAAASKAPWE